MNCPKCRCGDTVDVYGALQCGCCGLVFYTEDYDNLERGHDEDHAPSGHGLLKPGA